MYYFFIQRVLASHRTTRRLLVQKELQGRERECLECRSRNVSDIYFFKEVGNKENIQYILYILTEQLAVGRDRSPSSRLSYATYNREGESLIARPRRLSGHGIRSTGNSREPSPQRFGMDRSFASKIR